MPFTTKACPPAITHQLVSEQIASGALSGHAITGHGAPVSEVRPCFTGGLDRIEARGNALLADRARTVVPCAAGDARHGISILVDPGISARHLQDILESSGEYIGLVKFGWGTTLVSTNLNDKISS
ncbi:phosphosulfolactate synthase [Streptomyces klenkii]|uniref:phosphosulfolactate synthase n=1 Tax=Streptomyces klenkii TaxID=1420899 RepID=UPI0033A2C807